MEEIHKYGGDTVSYTFLITHKRVRSKKVVTRGSAKVLFSV